MAILRFAGLASNGGVVPDQIIGILIELIHNCLFTTELEQCHYLIY
jgi:hypothetical protein